MAYFDDLVPDYTVEVPFASDVGLETMRRLLFMFKLAINGHAVLLADDNDNVVAVSPEFITQFTWTLEEFQEIDIATEFFHADSLEIAQTHNNNHLAAPYIARCYNKAGESGYFQVQGLCVEFDGEHWRMLSFELI